MSLKWAQFMAVVWKCYLTIPRNFSLLILEVWVIMMIFMNSYLMRYTSQDIKEMWNEAKPVPSFPINLIYAPSYSIIDDLMDKAKMKLNTSIYRSYSSEKGMLANLPQFTATGINTVAVSFDSFGLQKWPKKMKYRIRCAMAPGVELLFRHPLPSWNSSSPPSNTMDKLYYFTTPFLTVQHAINMAFIETRSNQSSSLEIRFQELPNPSHIQIYNFTASHTLVMVVFIMILMEIQIVVQEKTSGIKELQKMAGMKSWILWLGYFIHAATISVLNLIIITCIWKFGLKIVELPPAKHADIFVLIIFILFYMLSGIIFGFVCSTFINNELLMIIPGVVWIWTDKILPLPRLAPRLRSIAYIHLLIPQSCLSWGWYNIENYEKTGEGINWSNMWRTSNPYAPIPTMGFVIFAFLFQILCMLILLWYLDHLFPGSYGVPRRWNFPFSSTYWKSSKIENAAINFDSIKSRPEIEENPQRMAAMTGIRVRKLCKQFKGRTVVNNLDIDIYNNEITMLLGHNGAGKTVTMNIITGMMKATSGTVLIDGYNIETSDKARASLGYCTQHNLNFSNLTVLENVTYFSMIKGYSQRVAKMQARRSLALLALEKKSKEYANKLSGGMQRRLSLAIALAGESNVLVLDEPTSGLDPETRREIWDIVLRLREGRCILVSTHYLDEADILGDRIAIMHHGQLFCYGSSLFLKKLYGTGYLVTVMLEPSTDLNPITETIRTVIPEASVDKTLENCVIYKLPTTNTTELAKLFMHIDCNKQMLGINNVGVTFNNLEDVFLKVQRAGDRGDNIKTTTIPQPNRQLPDNYDEEYKDKKLSGTPLQCQQFKALLKKRCQYMQHNKGILLGLIFVPLVAIGWIILIIAGGYKSDNRFELRLDPYVHAQVLYSNTSQHADLAKYLETTVREQQAKINNVPQVSKAIMSVGEKNMERYLRTLIVAFELNETVANVMYGPWAIHGPAIALNVLSNALLRLHMRNDDTTNSYSLDVVNHPIISTVDIIDDDSCTTYIYVVPMLLTVAMMLLLKLPHSERESGFKQLQIMTGVPRYLYWLTIILFDIIVLNVIFAFYIALFISMIGKSLLTASAIAVLSLLFFLFGLAFLPIVYFCHYFHQFQNAFSIALFPPIVGTMYMIVREDVMSFQKIIYIDLLLPNYVFSSGLFRILRKSLVIYEWEQVGEQQQQYICAQNVTFHPCCDLYSSECANFQSYFTGNNSILYYILFLILDIILYSSLFLYIDSGAIEKALTQKVYNQKKKKLKDTAKLDNDVEEEKHRINNVVKERKSRRRTSIDSRGTIPRSDILAVHNLRKVFKTFYAVRGINFGVMPGECFGLLGINGAGKTTTFKMISGEISPSTGSTDILGYTLGKQKVKYYENLGYSPQHDALNFSLTTRETLELFAKLRGVLPQDREGQVRKWIKILGLKEYEDIPCGLYSGGNKRKLCVGIAVSGDPSLIMLDEPTSAVDVASAHKIWDVIQQAKANGQSIVLTSHKMEECEKLCERLAIMMDGQLRCIGSVPYLKRKFDQGYSIMMKLRADSDSPEQRETDVQVLKMLFEEYFRAKLTEEHGDILNYQVNTENLTPAKIFRFMEGLKRKMEGFLEDYTVCEPSLEQVFLSFAKEKMRFTK